MASKKKNKRHQRKKKKISLTPTPTEQTSSKYLKKDLLRSLSLTLLAIAVLIAVYYFQS